MDVLAFITKSEWPFVVGGCVWFFRKNIASILSSLHSAKISVAGTEAEFTREVEATAALAETPVKRQSTITKELDVEENAKSSLNKFEIKDKDVCDRPSSSEKLMGYEDGTGEFYDNTISVWSNIELSPAQDVFRAYARLEKAILKGAKDLHDELYLSMGSKHLITIVTYLDLSNKDKIVIANLRRLREAVANGTLSVTPEGAIKYASTIWKIIPRLEEALSKPRINTEIPKANFEELPEPE